MRYVVVVQENVEADLLTERAEECNRHMHEITRDVRLACFRDFYQGVQHTGRSGGKKNNLARTLRFVSP